MSQSPQVFRIVCATCTFVRGMSKLCKLAEIISFLPGKNASFTDSPEELRNLRHGPAVSLVIYHNTGMNIKPKHLSVIFVLI